MADFSHYNDYRPEVVTSLMAKGRKVTDELLLEVFRRLDPPLLDKQPTLTVIALLESRCGRRPMRGVPSLDWLARQISRQERPDVHPDFLKALSSRIGGKRGLSETERAIRFYRKNQLIQRDHLIGYLYWQLRSLIEESADTITHPVLGRLKLPMGLRPRDQAARMTWNFLHVYWDGDAPSESTILRIASMRH